MASVVEVVKEKKAGGPVLQWEHKAHVIEAETRKPFMTVITDLERLFSCLLYTSDAADE